MIHFIIKTLDSNNHHFSVEDDTTVEQLKEKIRERLGIEAHLQRLIFYGRVLQDDKKLMDIDVNGKVLHLVQRPPPSPRTRQRNIQANTTTNNEGTERTAVGMQQQIRRLMALTGPPDYLLENRQQLTLAPTAGRLELIRRMIAEIKTSLIRLAAHVNHEEYSGASDSGEVPVEQMDNELRPEPTQDEPEPNIDDNGDIVPENESRVQNSRRRSYRAMRVLRVRHTRPRDFAQLIDDLTSLQEQFAPHRENYVRMLRDAHVIEMPELTEEQREHEQHFVDLVSDIIHSFGHAYHAVADINFQVGMRNPRLSSEPVAPRHPIPLQAHINVVQSNRGPTQQRSENTTVPSNSAGTAPATVTSANATTESTGNGDTQGPRNTAQTRNTTTTPNVNVNVQPDPITYQVEIETRVPIAVPIENVVLSEMANMAAATNMQQQQQQNQEQQQNNQQEQGNRRQVQFDFDNLIRGLNQAGWLGESGLDGVEVLMSMEEIPQGAAGNNAGQQNIGEGGVYIAPMPWGSPPGADLLQNIVTSMIRQGLMPGVEGVALHVTGQAQDQTRSQTTGQTQQQTANGPGNQQQAPENQPRQPGLHLRHAASTARAHSVAMNNWVYDRYLQCDSMYARRHAQRRRIQYQQQVVAHERLRSMRTAAQNIETLRERIPNVTHEHMLTLIGFLNTSAQTPAVWLNAFMVAVARHLFLADAMCSVGSEPPLVPHEFVTLRIQLRNYVQNLITRSERTDGENAFQGVADFVVDEYADFINNICNITLAIPDVNMLESIRALVRSRLPAVIATVMSDSPGEVAAARFYGVISRVFMDLCTFIALVCPEFSDGLRAVYTSFMEQLVQDYDDAARQLLLTLSTENLNGVINDLRSHMDSVRQFVRYTDDFLNNVPRYPVQMEPMELSPSPSPVSADEAIQTPPVTPCPIHGPRPAVPSTANTSNNDDNTDSASTSSVKSLEADQLDEPAESPIPSRSAKSNINNAKPETTNTERSPIESSSSIQIVSPLMIMQHWREEWVPVISRDQQAQSTVPQEPYSDAYLSGMPAKKRRCVHQARPATTLDGFMNESAREAVSRTTTVEDNSALRSAFREHMRNMARERSAVSEDYDPLRYASAARFLEPQINKRSSPEGNGEKSDK